MPVPSLWCPRIGWAALLGCLSSSLCLSWNSDSSSSWKRTLELPEALEPFRTTLLCALLVVLRLLDNSPLRRLGLLSPVSAGSLGEKWPCGFRCSNVSANVGLGGGGGARKSSSFCSSLIRERARESLLIVPVSGCEHDWCVLCMKVCVQRLRLVLRGNEAKNRGLSAEGPFWRD